MSQQANCEEAAELEKKITIGDYTDENQARLASLKKNITDYNRTCAKQNNTKSPEQKAAEEAGFNFGYNGGRRGKKSRRNSKKRKTLRKKSTRRKTRSHKKYLFF